VSIPCWYHGTYDADKSRTYAKDGRDFDISYGSGSVGGYVSKDLAAFGDANAASFAFGEVTSVSGVSFYVSQMAGILGLAYRSISVDALPVFIDSSDLTDKSFAFYLHNNPELSYMTVPGYDESLLNGQEFTFHDVVEQKYWGLEFTSMNQAGQAKIDMSDYIAVIDSGTSLIMGPSKLINQLIDGIKVKLTCAGIDDLPNITFTLGGIDYTLEPSDYVLKITSNGITECQMGIMGGTFGPAFNYVILGDVFMRKYYTYFDKNNNRVGFV
jgi:hypothetical protein